MSVEPFCCHRIFYVFNLSREYLEGIFQHHQPCAERQRKADVALSPSVAGWRMVGCPDSMTDWAVFDLAWSILAGTDDDDFDLTHLVEEVDVPSEDLILAQYVHTRPDLTYYSLHQENDNFDVLFEGRRDDQVGLRFNVIEETMTLLEEGGRHRLSLLEYLQSRGVPAVLWPDAHGFSVAEPELFKVRVEAG